MEVLQALSLLPLLIAAIFAESIYIYPRNATVHEGNNFKGLCAATAGSPIRTCSFIMGGVFTAIILKPQEAFNENISYNGKSFESGHCGINIKHVATENSGPLWCTMNLANSSEFLVGEIILNVVPKSTEPLDMPVVLTDMPTNMPEEPTHEVVEPFSLTPQPRAIIEEHSGMPEEPTHTTVEPFSVAPQPRAIIEEHSGTPVLKILNKGTHLYVEGEQLRAVCSISTKQHNANISWFLGDVLLQDGLSAQIRDKSHACFERITQNLTRTLLWYDDGKHLKCVSSNSSLISESSSRQINVQYKPQQIQSDTGLEAHRDNEGHLRGVTLRINANPKPLITWNMEKMLEIKESESTNAYTVGSTFNDGPGKWLTTLHIHLVNEGILKCLVTAVNDHGSEIYVFSIPFGLHKKESSMVMQIFIYLFAGILLISLIYLVLCIMKKTRICCFSGAQSNKVAPEVEMTQAHHSLSSIHESMTNTDVTDDCNKEPACLKANYEMMK